MSVALPAGIPPSFRGATFRFVCVHAAAFAYPRLPGQLLTSHPPCRRSYVLTAAFQRGTDAAQVVHLHLPVTSPRGSLGAEHPIPVTCAGGAAAMRALSSACVVTSQEVPAGAPSLRSRSRTASSETGVGASAWPVDASGASSGAGAGAGAGAGVGAGVGAGAGAGVGAGGGAGLRVDGKMPWEQGWSCDVVAPAQDVVVSVRGFGLSTGQSRASHAASAEPDVSGPRSFAVTSSGVHLGKVVLDRCVALPGSSLRLLLDMSGAAVQTLQVRQPMCGRHGWAVVVAIRSICRPRPRPWWFSLTVLATGFQVCVQLEQQEQVFRPADGGTGLAGNGNDDSGQPVIVKEASTGWAVFHRYTESVELLPIDLPIPVDAMPSCYGHKCASSTCRVRCLPASPCMY